MANEGHKANVVVEQPAAEKAVEKKAKTPKVKKAKASKEKKPKTASHPPYFQMIKEALLALKEKGGSSPHAIAKYMEEKHKAVLPENFKKMLALQLKNSASKGKLIKVKASYKLTESGKKEKTPAAAAAAAAKKPTVASKKTKQTKPKKTAAPVARASATTPAGRTKKATKAPKTAAVKKLTPAKKAKKMTPAKAKQPKSIKSPVAKKARKAAA